MAKILQPLYPGAVLEEARNKAREAFAQAVKTLPDGKALFAGAAFSMALMETMLRKGHPSLDQTIGFTLLQLKAMQDTAESRAMLERIGLLQEAQDDELRRRSFGMAGPAFAF